MGRLRIANGRVLRPDGRFERGDVSVDQDLGRIIQVEETSDEPPPDDPDVLDATGCAVIPGLVNAHTHVAMTLLRGYSDDKALHAWLEEDIFPAEAELTPDDIATGARLGMVEMIKGGTTAFCDMYFEEGRIAEVAVEAGLRAVLGHGILTLGKDEDGIEEELATATSFVETYDGAGDGRIRAALMPHAMRTVDPAVLERVARLAEADEVPIHFHVSETADDVEAVRERDGYRPVGLAAETGILGAGNFGAHGVHLDGDDIERLATSGTGIAHCPTANLKLASGMAPVTDLLRASVPVGIGTDGPASNNDLDMFEEIRLAALLAKLRDDDASALPAADAFHLGTDGGRRLLGFDGGGIDAGTPADVTVVDVSTPHFVPDHDLLSHLVYTASKGDVRHTVCAGSVLLRDREVIPFDEDAVTAEANEAAHDLIARAR